VSKRKKNKDEFIPRLPDSMRDAINRSGTVLSKKRYLRHGRHMNPKNFGADVEDQIKNSDYNLFCEDMMEYFYDGEFSDYDEYEYRDSNYWKRFGF